MDTRTTTYNLNPWTAKHKTLESRLKHGESLLDSSPEYSSYELDVIFRLSDILTSTSLTVINTQLDLFHQSHYNTNTEFNKELDYIKDTLCELSNHVLNYSTKYFSQTSQERLE